MRSGSAAAVSYTHLDVYKRQISGFVLMALLLSLLVFVGEAVRDAFDPRKNVV